MVRHRLLIPYWLNASNLNIVAKRKGWPFAESRPATNICEEHFWTTPDRQNFISFVSDFGLTMNYLVVQGQNPGSIVAELERTFPILSVDDVLAAARGAQASQDRIDALYRAAVVSQEDQEDPRLRDLLVSGLSDPDPRVRQAAVFACSYATWPSLRTALDQIAAGDPDDDTRAMAGTALSSLNEHVWSREAD